MSALEIQDKVQVINRMSAMYFSLNELACMLADCQIAPQEFLVQRAMTVAAFREEPCST